MQTNTLRKYLLGTLLTSILGASFGLMATSYAQTNYPNRPIKIVVPFPPGGPTDNYARLLAIKMSESFKQPVVVENKAGGTGLPGSLFVMNAPADGYTLLFTSNSAHVISPLLRQPIPFDSVKDFSPISMALKYPMYLLVNPSLGVKSLPEFIQYAKANPTKLNYSSVGIGSGGHLACELFNDAAGTTVTHVPYKGAAPAQAALIGGETQMFCDSVGNSQNMVNAGKMQGLGLFANQRSIAAPNVPTMTEVGLQGLSAYIWLGLLGPPNLPREIQNKLSTEVVRIMNSPEISGMVLKAGNDLVANTPAQFGQNMLEEKEVWAKVIREKNIKPE